MTVDYGADILFCNEQSVVSVVSLVGNILYIV
jgi:hypothetical protein